MVSSPFGDDCGEWTDFDHFPMERKPSTIRLLMNSKRTQKKLQNTILPVALPFFIPFLFLRMFFLENSFLMYGQQPGAVCNQEQVIMARIQYTFKIIKEAIKILNFTFSKQFLASKNYQIRLQNTFGQKYKSNFYY